MSRLLKLSLFLIAALVICFGVLILVEVQTKIIHRALDNLLYDNQNHYLPCHKLPTASEVNEIVHEHQDVIRRIELVNPGLVGVEIDPSLCPGKADLVIWYASHQNRVAIEAILAGDTFFGVPYRLQNR